VFFGAIDTQASTLEFTMAELMRTPDAMKKLQAEVRGIVPKEQDIVREADLSDMAYLRAVIKESLRLHPVSTLIAPHLSMSSCDIDGFVVPAGVRALVNVWAIGRDARIWGDDAEAFVPDRFLDGGAAADVNFKGNDFQFLPFSTGRRMCPGMNFGLATIELTLANLVHRIDWGLPAGKETHDIDMSEVFGLVVHLKNKLLLVPKLQGQCVAIIGLGPYEIMNNS
jgi:cytochrome P450